MELIGRDTSLYCEKLLHSLADFLLGLLELGHVGRNLLTELGGEVFAEGIRDNKVAIS